MKVTPMHRLQLAGLDMRHLRLFIDIVEFGGLSAAATELNISLVSLSRALSSLETRFGVKLCSRGRAGFSITPHGREVYAAAQSLFSNVGEFELSIYNVARAVRGRIRVGIIDNMLSNPGPTIHASIGAFIRKYPDIFLELTILPKPKIESAVREASIDVGVTGDPFFFKSLNYVQFADEVHYVYVASNSVAAARLREGAKLSEVPYVRRRYKAPAFEVLEKRHQLRATATAGSLEAATILVAAGAGIGILPSHYVACMPHIGVEIVPVAETPFHTQLYAVHDAGGAPIVAEFVNFLEHHEDYARG